MRLGCCQNKNNIGGWFLQSFKQCIESANRQHVHLVYNINLISSLRRRICHFFSNFPDVIHTVVRSCVNLHYIHRRARSYGPARSARIAGITVHRMLTVDCLGKNFCNRGFPGTPCSTKKVCMSDTLRLDLIPKCLNNMLLSFYVCKGIRTKFSV